MLEFDQKRAFSIRLFILCSVVITICIILSQLDLFIEVFRSNSALTYQWSYNVIMYTLTGDTMQFVLPVMCTLPFSASFINEYKSGVLRYTLGRTTRRKYIFSKIITTFLSGGTVLTVSTLLVVLVLSFIFVPLEEVPIDVSVISSFGKYFQIIVRYFILGSVNGLLGLTISTATNNRYMAWIGPFMVEYLLIIFYERYFDRFIFLYPKNWLNLSNVGEIGYGLQNIWLIVLSCSLAFLFWKVAQRRLEHL